MQLRKHVTLSRHYPHDGVCESLMHDLNAYLNFIGYYKKTLEWISLIKSAARYRSEDMQDLTSSRSCYMIGGENNRKDIRGQKDNCKHIEEPEKWQP